jgi:hypothetical protein
MKRKSAQRTALAADLRGGRETEKPQGRLKELLALLLDL